MDAFQAIVLGIVQGLTEFLPISSTAHLRIVPAFFGWEDPGAAFTAVVQLGTMAAVLLYFRHDLWRILRTWWRSLREPELRSELDARMGWYIGLGTIPIAIFGFIFRDQIESGGRDLYVIGVALIVFGLVLQYADHVGRRDRALERIGPRDAAFIGVAQALALIPGVSRSGSTISAGLFRGFDRESAARYSFLLSIPAVVLSGLFEARKIGGEGSAGVGPTLIATLLAFVVGYASIAWLLRYLVRHSMTLFVIYRVVLGSLVLALTASGAISNIVRMAVRERVRMAPSVFRLPVEKLRDGHYSDAYFNLTKSLLEADDRHPRVLMQAFQRKESILGGIDEAIAVLKQGAGHYEGDRWVEGWEQLEVRALHEGDEVAPWESVLTIEGDYSEFAHLETVYLGVLARRTLIMHNVREVVDAARGKPILYFPARHDHWLVQTGDGWAAHIAGAIGVSTDAQASWWGGRGVGTVPHGLIAAYGGDTALAARRFADRFARDMNVTVLVDFENDSVRTALEVAEALGDDLWGVRLDTSDRIADESLQRLHGGDAPTGVAAELVHLVRSELDSHGYPDVKVVVSGGFNAARIHEFEKAGVPVDSYGVGSSLIRGANDFTADVVIVDGRPCAKVGREYRPNPRLETVR